MNAYYTRKIAAAVKHLAGKHFPKPVETLTLAQRESMETTTLREVSLTLNGNIVGTQLTYTSWPGGMPYMVSGHTIDGNWFAEQFNTQDEAEQEYIVRASYVRACMDIAMRQLGDEMDALANKVDGGAQCDDGMHSWTNEVGLLPPDTRCTRPGCDATYGHPD